MGCPLTCDLSGCFSLAWVECGMWDWASQGLV